MPTLMENGQGDMTSEPTGNMLHQQVTRSDTARWTVVAASFMCHFIVGGVFYSFGLFYIEFVDYFQCTVSEAGWIGSTFISCFHLSGLFFSVIVRNYGCRLVATSGALVAAIGFISTSFATSVPLLYLTYGVITGTGCGMIWLPTLVVVQQYFTTKRSLAAGISTSGFTTGTIAMTPVQRYLIDAYSWRGASLIIAGFLLHCAVFSMFYRPLVSKTSPVNMYHQPDHDRTNAPPKRTRSFLGTKTHSLKVLFREFGDLSLMKNDLFVMFCAGTFLMDIGMIAFSQHNPSRAVHYGVSVAQASLIPLINGVSDAISRVASGLIGNCHNVDRTLQYGVLILLGGLLETMAVFAKTFEVIAFYTVLFGLFTGGFLGLQQTVQVDLFSIEKIGRSQALLSGFVSIACLITTPLAGYLFDVTGDYDVPFYVTGSLHVMGGLILCAIPVLDRRRGSDNQAPDIHARDIRTSVDNERCEVVSTFSKDTSCI